MASTLFSYRDLFPKVFIIFKLIVSLLFSEPNDDEDDVDDDYFGDDEKPAFDYNKYSNPSSALWRSSFRKRPTKMRDMFACDQCDHVYNRSSSLCMHKKLYCGKTPEQVCPHCEYVTYQKSSLARHIARNHRKKARSRR